MPDDTPEPQFVPVGSQRRITTYRIARPHAGIVSVGKGRFEATEYADRRTGFRGRILGLKDSMIGSAKSNVMLIEERLSKKIALAVFSSDALSSNAYATQEILLILVLAGTGAIRWSLPIAAAIAFLMAVVIISYRQTVRAYPTGGGAYIVAHENLGPRVGLIAASSLLIDYVLTVAVSIAAAVEAIASAVPDAHAFAVPIGSVMVLTIALGNLRGIRESGAIFAIPTYGFVVVLSGTLVFGIIKVLLGDNPNVFAAGEPMRHVEGEQAIGIFLILKAFSAGCAALTGVEAISNGVAVFKKPEGRNAATTLATLGVISIFMFLGATMLARHYGIVYAEGDRETVLSQIGAQVFGKNFIYYTLQVFTAGILYLAANTAFADFPRLAAILARDGYMPRIFHQRGSRLVFSYGIAALTFFSILLLILFNAQVTRLIPLYALGVFLSFTISQSGMVVHWRKTRAPGWRRSQVVNGFGASVTGVVFVVILTTKFADGAWAIVLLIPLLALGFWWVGRFYKDIKLQMRIQDSAILPLRPEGTSRTPVLVPVEDINYPTMFALSAACARSSDVAAVHVHYDPDDEGPGLAERWNRQFPEIPLIVIESPYRTVAEPFSWYVSDRLKEWPNEVVVIVPVVQVRHWWQRPLVNQNLKRLKTLIGGRRTVTLVEQPFAVG